jgi:hypothetical protein
MAQRYIHDEYRADETVVCPDACTLATEAPYGTSINLQAHQKECIASAAGQQYVAFYDARRRVCVGRRTAAPGLHGPMNVVSLPDSSLLNGLRDPGAENPSGWDSHNAISLGISAADGSIHLAFDHHCHDLRYRRSQPGVATADSKTAWSPSLFEPETSTLGGQHVKCLTYPQFTQTPDGGLVLIFRTGYSGGGDLYLSRYDPVPREWTAPVRLTTEHGVWADFSGNSKTRCPYTNGLVMSESGRAHLCWVWRESTQGANRDICYAYSDDLDRWFNQNGQLVAQLSTGNPLSSECEGLAVVPVDRRQSLMNQPDVVIDSKSRPHLLVWHRVLGRGSKMPWDRAASAYHHYYKHDSGSWVMNILPGAVGTRARIAIGPNDDLFAVLPIEAARESGQDTLYPATGLWVLRARAADHYKEWEPILVDDRSFIGDPAIDATRMRQCGSLTICVQDHPKKSEQPTPLRLIDLQPREAAR